MSIWGWTLSRDSERRLSLSGGLPSARCGCTSLGKVLHGKVSSGNISDEYTPFFFFNPPSSFRRIQDIISLAHSIVTDTLCHEQVYNIARTSCSAQ
jgi:hypothetical protein